MKALATVVLCCLLGPASILAAESTAAQASPAQIYAQLFTGQQKEVVSAAEAMPADKYNFAPTKGAFEGARTFAQQVTHIAASQYYLFEDFGVKSNVDGNAIDKLTSKDDIVKALKDSYAFANQAIATITAQNAFDEIGAHKSTRTGQVTHAFAHNDDHYGQMVVYLRMNGIVPPASRKP